MKYETKTPQTNNERIEGLNKSLFWNLKFTIKEFREKSLKFVKVLVYVYISISKFS